MLGYIRLVRWPTCVGVLALTASLAGVQPMSAAAQSGGRADPRTPSGTEYDIPLEEARRDAAGGPNGAGRSRTRRPGGTGSAAPGPGGGGSGTSGGGSGAGSSLFGAGISAAGPGSGGDVRGRDRSDPAGGTQGGRGSGEPGDGGRVRPGEPAPLGSIPPPLRADGSGRVGSWWPALLAVAVLAAGAGLGLLITRLRARGGTTS
jgi:hypothetical protein